MSAKNVLVYLKVPASKVLAKNESVPHGKALQCKASHPMWDPVSLCSSETQEEIKQISTVKAKNNSSGIGEPQKFERLLPVFLVGVIQNIATWYHVAPLTKKKPTPKWK
ncbi:hypothetical protein DAI13_18060 [Enterococcus faecalis]|uniref:Uncharacterized protein n=1 Tax=Enterococcus faecalis TaxID=1351 RepID=A0A855UDN2_ENTFL|nr:hypothetical protein DAI13_18060 [Enterococcus faecalis]